MVKVYLSSTYDDLKVCREAAYHALRQMRHDVIAMEDYVARDLRSLDKCLADVATCDLYIGLFAWRYGYVPLAENPERKSITDLEYRKACEVGIPRLIFILDEKAPWPLVATDVFTNEGNRGEYITKLRQELAQEKLVSFFKSSEHLASLVGPAVHLWERELKNQPITQPDYFEQRTADLGAHTQPFDHMPCLHASLVDLGLEKVSEFLNRDLVRRQEDYRSEISIPSQLVQFGLLLESHPTHGALLCFGQNPQAWLAGATTRCINWHGNTRHGGWHDDGDYRGTLLAQFESTMNFLRKCLRFSRIISQSGRTEQYEIPLVALQEAVANALVHREYASLVNDKYIGRTDHVQVEVFDNRVEIKSPGPLPPPMTLDVLCTESTSHPRNPLIARIFYLYGYVERVGSGIQRMQDAMVDADLSPPLFELSDAQTFKVIFDRPSQVTSEILVSDEFAKLLMLGLEGIATKGGRPLEDVIEASSTSIGLNSSSLLQKWRRGQVPSTLDHITALTRVCIQEGGMDQAWLLAFLREAHYPTPGLLIAELFGSSFVNDRETQLHTDHNLYRIDWGEAPTLEQFYGRDKESAKLEQWIGDDHCRIVALLGIGGVGKSTLAARVAKQVKKKFDYIFWRSLQNAPPPESILKICIQFFSDQRQIDLPENVEDQISLLIEYLRKNHCLLVLDNIETVLQAGSHTGKYREGYEGYGKLIQRIGEVEHQSCLLLTSREKPNEIARFDGKLSPVRSLSLAGVDQEEGQKILQDKGLFGSDEAWADLIHLYSGNPLYLKIVSEPIQEVFEGDIAKFLLEEETVFGATHDLLGQQFRRLSELEREIMYWLAIEREAISLEELREDIVRPLSKRVLFEALESLRRRSMIQNSGSARFTMQPVIMEYVTDQFIEQMCEDIEAERLEVFWSHALIKAQAKDYVRNSQLRLILMTVLERLLTTLGKDALEKKISDILIMLHKMNFQKPGYAAGNVLNLLIHLKFDLRNYDFSHLTVWQAYLQGVSLPDINFAHANLARSVFTDTFGSILSVSISPNGRLLAAGTANNEIRLWQTPGGTPFLSYQGHNDWVRAVAFSSDGDILASGSDDQTVRLWNVSTGQCLKILRDHSGWIRSVVFSPDGSILASGSEDQTIRLWDVSTGQCLTTLRGHNHRVYSVAFSPDGSILASGSHDQTVRLWDVNTGQCLTTLQEHSNRVRSVAFSPNGETVTSSSDDQTIRLWDVSTGQCLTTLRGHNHRVYSVAFSPDGSILASGSHDQAVRLWDVSTGHCLKVLQGHSSRIWSLAFSPNGDMLISGSENQMIRLWDISTGQCLKVLQGHSTWIYTVAFSPDGSILASGSEDQAVRLWDISTGQCLQTLPGHTDRVNSVAFSPDGGTLASGGHDQTVRLWDVSTGQCLRVLQGHNGWVRSVAFSPDGGTLASGSHDQMVRLWDVSTGQCLTTLQGHANRIWSLAFNPDGGTLASGGHDQTVRLWDVSTGQCLRVLGRSSRIRSVAFSPDGSTFASGSEDWMVRLWEVSTGQCLQTLQGHTDRVNSVAFSPDGSTLASGSEDRVVRLWEISTGQCLQILRGHTHQVYAVAFSPDGSILASSSHDGTIKFWDLQTGICLKTFRSDRPYERMNITDVRGLTEAQKATLKALGAIEGEQGEPL